MLLCPNCNNTCIEYINIIDDNEIKDMGNIKARCELCEYTIFQKKQKSETNHATNQETHLKNIIRDVINYVGNREELIMTNEKMVKYFSVERNDIPILVVKRFIKESLQEIAVRDNTPMVNYICILSSIIEYLRTPIMSNNKLRNYILLLFEKYQMFLIIRDGNLKSNISYPVFIDFSINIIFGIDPELINSGMQVQGYIFTEFIKWLKDKYSSRKNYNENYYKMTVNNRINITKNIIL